MVWLFIAILIGIPIHELAHFIVGKLVKCGVEVVSMGFGKPFFKKQIGKTTYQLCPIILGGYCKFVGELNFVDDPRAFSNKKYLEKVAIVVAGPLVNILLGFFLMTFYKFTVWEYVGYINIVLGVTNLIPLPPLDGSYPIMFGLEKIYGKEVGLRKMRMIYLVGMILVHLLNLVVVGWLVWYYVIVKIISKLLAL